MRQLLKILTLLIFSLQLNAQTDSLRIVIDSIPTDTTEAFVEIIDPVETMPVFPGGQDSLRTFIERNNNWQVGRETIVGKVFIAFVVEVDGSITNIEIMRGLHPSCDEEAKRIIGLMPNWKPGEQMGTPVRTKMILPIAFDGLK
ncbi:energy transducer TonB [Marinoscillum pacificum]|uniref:energy transducer TonB n=1 Tax=Marinoscillum pacificum TaxID=392723 RepID=UPI0021589EEA|nr:energy transducer TonB [Marinoscillum pacificum]